jgi:hypothetical protein
VSPGRSPGVVLVAVLPALLSLLGCTRAVDGIPMPGPQTELPQSADELGELIVAEVPSGLRRMPDDQLDPPAGPKRVGDIAGYSDDPAHERDVLERYGYRFGWERFWGEGSGPVVTVFVDQFKTRSGAGTYADDLARNDAEHYEGVLHENPSGLPGGCSMLTIEEAEPDVGLEGPAAFAWCRHGVFSVAVSAVGGTVSGVQDEVGAVMREQLDRLPPG